MAATEGLVLVGSDGSPDGYPAVRWAAEQAARLGAGVHILHAWLWPLFNVDQGPAASAPPGAGLQAQARGSPHRERSGRA